MAAGSSAFFAVALVAPFAVGFLAVELLLALDLGMGLLQRDGVWNGSVSILRQG